MAAKAKKTTKRKTKAKAKTTKRKTTRRAKKK
jgi:hypothetical protein